MNLVIVAVVDLNTDKERIELKAIGNDNTINYILVDTGKEDHGSPDNKCSNAFWFPNQPFKKGDIIRVFTKAGRASSISFEGKKRYTFYWGIKGSVWEADAENARLLRIVEFASKQVK